MSSSSDLSGEWILTALNESPIVSADYQTFVLFDLVQNRFSGNAGCNRMSGKVSLTNDSDSIRFSEVLTTRMACPALSQEQAFLAALENVARFEKNPRKHP